MCACVLVWVTVWGPTVQNPVWGHEGGPFGVLPLDEGKVMNLAFSVYDQGSKSRQVKSVHSVHAAVLFFFFILFYYISVSV